MKFYLVREGEGTLFAMAVEELCRMGHEFIGYSATDLRPPSFYASRPGLVVLPVRDLALGEWPRKTFAGIRPAVLTKSDLEGLASEAWNDYCLIADRSHLSERTICRHRVYFRDTLRYCIGMIRQFGIDCLLFCGAEPHCLADIIFYHAARRCNCKTIIVKEALQAVLLTESWREGYGIVPDKSFDPNVMTPEQKDFFDLQLDWLKPGKFAAANQGGESRIKPENTATDMKKLTNVRDLNRAMILSAVGQIKKPMWSRILDDFKYVAWEAYYHLRMTRKMAVWPSGGGRMFLPHSSWPRWVAFKACMRNFRNGGRLQKEYRALSRTPDLSVPFIYFPLHLQPELTTGPLGGWFCDQFLAAAILAESLPAGWRLYIKEHPTQLKNKFPLLDLGAYIGRWPELYRDLAELPNTFLAPFDMPSDVLVDGARLCATITGSAALEALARGKPALVFGDVWYDSCVGCERVSSTAETAAAIENLSAMSPDAIKKHFSQFMAGFMKQAATTVPLGYFPTMRFSETAGRERFGKKAKELAMAIERRFSHCTGDAIHE